MNTPWEVSPLLAVAPYIRHLEFQASLLHPDALYAIRTTHFPNIVSLRASYKVVLNAFNTITLHKDMVEFPQLRELSVRHVGTPSFTEDLVVDSWNTLVRLHVQIDIMEALRGQPYSANLAHLVSLREVCISFRNSCAVYYAEYLENFVVPSFVEVVIVVINREWYSTGAIQAPPPSARYRYHPALVFVSFRTPYFLRHHHIPDSEHMAHLANRFYTCETTDSWRNIWNQARRMNLSRSKDVVNDGSRVELQYTAMESL
ncbi:hypothetical protein VNI00_016558 [Paramarasmius palmivorus]|uniref:Uncharacterized protein n=1 Tax=Paramarasmius palmivorus TaxID=297713 RepID=A0AAW0BD38_9AGAR